MLLFQTITEIHVQEFLSYQKKNIFAAHLLFREE